MDDTGLPGRLLMRGIVGSKAYGWDTAESDTDHHGVFALPTERFLGLSPMTVSDLSYRPDADQVYHEVGHFVRLALRGNPSALELLYLPDDLVVDTSPTWRHLVAVRSWTLGASRIAQAYTGFAREQLLRLNATPPGPERLAKRAKHARHLKRVLDTGLGFYRDGLMNVRVGEREEYFDFGEAAARLPGIAQDYLHVKLREFEDATSPLPAEPREDVMHEWLVSARRGLMTR